MLSKTALRLIGTLTSGTVGCVVYNNYHKNSREKNYKFCKTAKEKEQFIRDYQYIYRYNDGITIDDPSVFHVTDSGSDLKPAETIDWEDARSSLPYSSWFNLCKDQIVELSSVPVEYQDYKMCYAAVKDNRGQFRNLPKDMFNNKQFIKDVVYNTNYGYKLPMYLSSNVVDVDMYIYAAINDPQFYPKMSPKKLLEINFWPKMIDYYLNCKKEIPNCWTLLNQMYGHLMTDELYEHLLNLHFWITIRKYHFLTENRIKMICNKLKKNPQLANDVPKSYLANIRLKFKTLEVCKILVALDSTNLLYTDTD